MKPTGREEGFGDDALHLEAMRSLLPLLEKVHETGEGVTRGVSARRGIRAGKGVHVDG